MMSRRRWRRASRLQQELSLHGAAGEEGVCLGGLAQREPAGDPGGELARSHLVEHGGGGSGPPPEAPGGVAGPAPPPSEGTPRHPPPPHPPHPPPPPHRGPA